MMAGGSGTKVVSTPFFGPDHIAISPDNSGVSIFNRNNLLVNNTSHAEFRATASGEGWFSVHFDFSQYQFPRTAIITRLRVRVRGYANVRWANLPGSISRPNQPGFFVSQLLVREMWNNIQFQTSVGTHTTEYELRNITSPDWETVSRMFLSGDSGLGFSVSRYNHAAVRRYIQYIEVAADVEY